MAEHTKEPWGAEGVVIAPPGYQSCAIAICQSFLGDPDGLSRANARRIVACVNACAGISIEDLEADEIRKLIGAMRFVLAFYEPGQTYLDTNAWKHAEAGARRVMAKLDVK